MSLNTEEINKKRAAKSDSVFSSLHVNSSGNGEKPSPDSIKLEVRKISGSQDFGDVHVNMFGILPQIEHTESRIPALELMLSDEKLLQSMIGDVKHSVIDKLAEIICKSSPEAIVYQFNLFNKQVIVKHQTWMPREVSEAITKILCVYCKQQFIKIIDIERASINVVNDAYKNSKNEASEKNDITKTSKSDLLRTASICSGLEDNFVDDVYYQQWQLIIAVLKSIRNICVNKNIQTVVEDYQIGKFAFEQLISCFGTSAEDSKQTIHDHQKIRTVLTHTVTTLLSNLMVGNKPITDHYLHYFWFDNLEQLFDLCKADSCLLNDFIRLMHSLFLSLWQDLEEDLLPSVHSKANKEICELVNNLRFIYQIKLEKYDIAVDKAIESNKFINFYVTIARHVLKFHQKSIAQEAKLERQISQVSKHYLSIIVEWFHIFNLKLFTLGKSKGFVVVLLSILHSIVANDAEHDLPHLLNYLFYIINEYVIKSTDEINMIRELSRKHFDVSDKKLNSKDLTLLNFDISGFHTFSTLNQIFQLGMTSMAKSYSNLEFTFLSQYISNKEYKIDTFLKSLALKDAEKYLHAVTKVLISISTFPKFNSKCCKQHLCALFILSFLFLKDSAKYYESYVKKSKSKNFRSETSELYQILQVVSLRDLCLLCCTILELNCVENVQLYREDSDFIRKFVKIQELDIGCEQAATLLLKFLNLDC